MKRTAAATWQGNGKNGQGYITTQSESLQATAFSFGSRFGEATGTNPEELLAAAGAICFNMKLSFVLTEAGFPPHLLHTSCMVNLGMTGITAIHLLVRARVPGITEPLFVQSVREAEATCPFCRIIHVHLQTDAVLEPFAQDM